MHLSLDILFSLFAPATWFFWIPLGILVTKAAGSWRKCRDFCRTKYSVWERCALAIPSLAIMEIVWLACWLYGQKRADMLQMNVLRTEVCSKILVVFLTLIPSTAFLIYRFKGCRRFVLLICLIQMWIAAAVTASSLLAVAMSYYYTK